MHIDDSGILVPEAAADQRLTLEVDGRAVWSFVPSRDGHARDGEGHLVPWPAMLVPHLNGVLELQVRALDRDEVIFTDKVRLGAGDGVIALRDSSGRPLRVSKTRSVTATMFADASDDTRAQLVDHVVRALDLLRERGFDAFLAYGNLLGAVRDGRLIGHDDDADIAYLASSDHPVDIIRESFVAEREFQRAGWETRRLSGGTFKLRVRPEGGPRFDIDVFTAFYLEGQGDLLHMMPFFGHRMPRESLAPAAPVTLEGRAVRGPARPEDLLEATFGPGWRTPDPAFKHSAPRWLTRRLQGLFRGERRHQKYWDVFYATKANLVPADPSPFARWVLEQSPRPTSVLDIGAGTGRDSLWFAAQGLEVLGCDYSQAGVAYATARAADAGSSARFRRLNLYDLRQMLTAGALVGAETAADAVYARFLVHSLEDEGRRNLWRFSRAALAGSRGRVYLEFRTAPTEHVFGEHYRQFVTGDVVRAELADYGFSVEHLEERHGLAVHNDEDPKICRMIAKLEVSG